MRISTGLIALGASLVLGACGERQSDPPQVRPVPHGHRRAASWRFVGLRRNDRARAIVRTSAFACLARMFARDVNVGDSVGKGTRLAAIDPLALEPCACGQPTLTSLMPRRSSKMPAPPKSGSRRF